MAKLIIENIDDSGPLFAPCADDLNKDFQRKIAGHFSVCPVLSNRAYEVFIDAGVRRKATHVAFGIYAHGRASDSALISRMFDHLLADLTAMWPVGSTVIWRRFPEVTEYYEEETCAACGHTSSSMPRVKITFRLGSPAPKRTKPMVDEGGLLSQFIA